MSDTAFPFGAPAPEGPAAPEGFEGPEATSGSDNNRRMLYIVAGAGALVLLAAVYFLFLKGGGSSSDLSAAPVVHHTVTHQAAKKPAAPAHAKVNRVPSTFKDAVGRDPFKPLFVAPVTAPGTSGATTGTTGTTTPAGAPSTDLGNSSSSTTTSLGTRVSLVHVYTKNGVVYASTKINDTVYNPKVGATFASSFKLVSVSGKSATYLDGDVQFTLHEGQEVLK